MYAIEIDGRILPDRFDTMDDANDVLRAMVGGELEYFIAGEIIGRWGVVIVN